MSGILKLKDLNKGNVLKQGDKTLLKYQLQDRDGEPLNLVGKDAEVRLLYSDFATIGYEQTNLTVLEGNIVQFTIDQVIPARPYYLEVIVDGQHIFPSRSDEGKFTIDPSSRGAETNIIEIVGKDVLIQEVKTQVDTELQPLVTSLESAQQAETQRASAESARASAEEQRKTDHANRSAELAGKADKVVLKNLVENGDFSNGLSGWVGPFNGSLVDGVVTGTHDAGAGLNFIYKVLHPNNAITGEIIYAAARLKNNGTITIGQNSGANTLVPVNDDFAIVSNRVTRNSADGFTFLIRGNGVTISLDWAMDFNLTRIFGAGNEPTKEEMDELIKVTGYIDGEYALNNKELLIWTLALIRRNKNAIVALGGA